MRERRPSRPQSLTGRSLAAGLASLAILVSLLTVATTANPDSIFGMPDAAPDSGDGRTAVTVAPSSPQEIPIFPATISCFRDNHCEVRTSGSNPIHVCPATCEDARAADPEADWVAGIASDSTTQSGEIPIVWGIARTDRTTRNIEAISIDEPRPTDFFEITYERGVADPLIASVGDPGMTISRRTTAFPDPPVVNEQGSDAEPVFSVSMIVLVLIGAAFLALVVATVVQIIRQMSLGPQSDGSTFGDDGDDEEEDVTSPIELEVPFTSAQAEERAEVIRDLLIAVRNIDDPRDSIQRGYAALETGFGRPHLARMKNETSEKYLRRVLGDSAELREPMTAITRLFERARFSELPVDQEMRSAMVTSLEAVQSEWEKRAVALTTDSIPAPQAHEFVTRTSRMDGRQR